MRTLLPICCALLLAGCGSETPDSRAGGDPPTSRYKETLDEARATAESLQGALDTYYARKLGQKPTTGQSSNRVVTPGKHNLAELRSEPSGSGRPAASVSSSTRKSGT